MAMPMILPPRQFRMGALYWNDLWEGVLGNGETWTVVDKDRTVAVVMPVPEVGVPIYRNIWPSGHIELHISPFMDAREP